MQKPENEEDIPQGPRRKAPMYYAGETYGTTKMKSPSGHIFRIPRPILYPDVERHPNGAIPGIRDKAARRLIRSALKRKFSKVDRDLKLPRAMQAQAREVTTERADGKMRSKNGIAKAARRLYAAELAIHQTGPNAMTRSQRRAHDRMLKKAGKKDAIAQLVDRMAGGKL